MKKVCTNCGRRAPPTFEFCDVCDRIYSRARASYSYEVSRAIKKGLLIPAKNFKCTDCDSPAAGYDHRSYDKPMAIQPVCKPCNYRRGRARLNALLVRRQYEIEELTGGKLKRAASAVRYPAAAPKPGLRSTGSRA